MTRARFTEEFKEEAVKQAIEREYTAADVAKRLGVSAQSLYKWKTGKTGVGSQWHLLKPETAVIPALSRDPVEAKENRGQIPILSNISVNWDLTPFSMGFSQMLIQEN